MGDDAGKKEEDAGRKIVFSYGFVSKSDMPTEMKKDVVDICISSLEKHSINSECAEIIKVTMDEKFGGHWNVIVGDGFQVDCTYDLESQMTLLFAGTTAVFIWKCSD
ncbi:dynein light chain 4, axonemal [Eurytemora carolleeae]|uniref:dynein light chain 4, axonemal n=1 Tax=Eurytemora carolleeae TaxID=1294199 RepID=UPI000C79367A|nr:dynein light chain 4, axonemal [Eurytemora carolleeae]XP_023327922.1 dynein light chain 4, axonemal [Eurytemora carolleeae]|eukprot:XP_023327921.1 dynein light chain 4, axonemal-like [Eurytemora affinis]